ncbi:FKBP-type peptidyl-prolyl cis-trans isomerase [Solicola gregarius]|uniref:Peptidyl-prolyl cis-trans isomerase n=1 Tax=Solicola gregarius TaxID=2908642 RepID=A0AA46TGW7_9ACTN|nr:FKBP-type peptidyl-prolyl cis-trans isomerase [Solicola gregarius]UYM05050.1 FKBP-type peptidyl-prolyl cis-trans isomerase [Solicola gregarius]
MRRLCFLLSVCLLVLTACGDDDGGSDGSGTSNSDEVTLEGDSGSATVEGAYGDEPKVTVDGTFEVSETSVEVMTEGDGATVKDTDTVKVDYHGVGGTTGKVFDSSFQRGEPIEFPLNQVVPGFSKGIAGQKVGSRVAISVAPEDGYPDGTPDGAIKAGESLVFVVDIIDVVK